MLAQTARKSSSPGHREPETERLERLRREVQEIFDARNRQEISEDEALQRIARLRSRTNSFFGGMFHRHS